MLSEFSQKRGNDTIQLSHLQSKAALCYYAKQRPSDSRYTKVTTKVRNSATKL